jgi:hypothetical protein
MSIHSKQLALNTVAAGMVLSDDLVDDTGKILLPQGTTLTEGILVGLARHNVAILPILCEALSAEDEAAELRRQKARLARLFRKHVEDEATALMLQYVTDYRMGDVP